MQDRRVLPVSPLLAASCLGWQGNGDGLNKEISNPPTAYLHPECVVTGRWEKQLLDCHRPPAPSDRPVSPARFTTPGTD